MELQDWSSVIAIVVGVIAILGVTSRKIDATNERIDRLRDDMDVKFTEAREHTDARFAEAREHTDARFAEAREHTDARFAEAREHTDARFAEALGYTDARFSESRTLTETRFADLGARIDDLRDEMRDGFNDVRARLSVLEQRTYDLGHQPPSKTG